MTPNEKLKEIREKSGLSQAKFAQKFETMAHVIKSIEYGKQKTIPDDLALKLEEEYNISFKWWRTSQGEMYTKPTLSQIVSKEGEINYLFHNWGTRLYLIQKANNLTSPQMAKILKIDERRYYDLVNKSQPPTIDEIKAIKANFDVCLDDLFFGDNEKFEKKKSDKLNLSPQDISKLKKLLESI